MSYHDPFLRLRELSERCFADLERKVLRPQEIWLTEGEEHLEAVKLALMNLVQQLAAGMDELAKRGDARFASVTGLDEWETIGRETADWKRDIERLRPGANAQHVKESLISIRLRLSELVDALAVRSTIRDPASDVANSTLAAETVAGLIAEREHRQLGLGLLEGGGVDPWNMTLQTLDASVVEWSTRLGPEHRVQLEQLCHQLLEDLEAIAHLPDRSPALDHLADAAGRNAPALRNIYDRLIKVPADKMDAGLASDFHYMGGLAKRIVESVKSCHGGVIADQAGKEMPKEVVELFQHLHLAVPRVRKRTGTQTLSRREIELAFGRRLYGGSEQKTE